MNIPSTQKVAVTCILLLGLLSTAAGVVRLAFLIIDGYETAPGYQDVIGIDTIVLGWSQVEAGIGIVAACLPTLRPLFVGRSPESLIDSIRSVFSLRPFGSGHLREQNRQRRRSDSEQLHIPLHPPLAARLVHPHLNNSARQDSVVGPRVSEVHPGQPNIAVALQ